MVSTTIQHELRLAYERLRLSLVIFLLWIIISILDATHLVNLNAEGSNYIVYAIMSSSSVVLMVLGLGIQIEPLVKNILRNRKNLNEFWEQEINLKPNIIKRALISELITLAGVIIMMIGLLFTFV